MSLSTAHNDLAGLVRLADASRLLGLQLRVATLDRWAREGRVPAVRVAGRWYIHPERLRGAIVREKRP